jgi:hypothetical protein
LAILGQTAERDNPGRLAWEKVGGDPTKVLVASLLPTRYTLSMPGRQGNDSLNAEAQIGNNPWLMTTGTGASVIISRLDIIVGLPKREVTAISPADGIREDPSHLEGSAGRVDPRAMLIDNLGVSCHNNG